MLKLEYRAFGNPVPTIPEGYSHGMYFVNQEMVAVTGENYPPKYAPICLHTPESEPITGPDQQI